MEHLVQIKPYSKECKYEKKVWLITVTDMPLKLKK